MMMPMFEPSPAHRLVARLRGVLDQVLVFTHWDKLRALGNSRIVQISGAFPLIGYVILVNEEAVRILRSTPFFGDRIDAAPSWRLYLIYYGLMFLGAGSLVYQVRCPYIVKKYADPFDFIRTDKESYTNADLDELARERWQLHERRRGAGRSRLDRAGARRSTASPSWRRPRGVWTRQMLR
jgi:hypothetical protein